jgi:hypothetical protein
MKINKQYIRQRMEDILETNRDFITGKPSEYIIDENTEPGWYYEYLDDSQGEVTQENIEILKEIAREYDHDENGKAMKEEQKITIETYQLETEHCLKNDYPFLFEAGESEGEDISAPGAYELFEKHLPGEALETFKASFEGEGWLTKLTDEFGEHYFWGDGPISHGVTVIHKAK